MGQKAKNAGKKKSKVASNKKQIGKQIVKIKANGSNEFLQEVGYILRDNVTTAKYLQDYNGGTCLRKTDFIKKSFTYIPA